MGHARIDIIEIEVIGSTLENHFLINGHKYMVASNEQEDKMIVSKIDGSMRKGWDKQDEKESLKQKDPKVIMGYKEKEGI